MKFQSVLDVQCFLTEAGAFHKLGEALGPSYVPTDEETASFIKKRTGYVNAMKDYRKSSAQKNNWRQNRTSMMRGIKAFHRSVAGKRFHRKLGNFLASRITRKSNEAMSYTSMLENLEFLVGLNSVKQHLFVEMDFFHQAHEQIELEEMVLDYSIPLMRSIEEKIISGEELNEDENVFLMDLTEQKEFEESLAAALNKPLTTVQAACTRIEEDLVKKGIAKEDQRFYPCLIEALRASNWETLNVG
jgi:hypothetical protein